MRTPNNKMTTGSPASPNELRLAFSVQFGRAVDDALSYTRSCAELECLPEAMHEIVDAPAAPYHRQAEKTGKTPKQKILQPDLRCARLSFSRAAGARGTAFVRSLGQRGGRPKAFAGFHDGGQPQ